MKLIGCYIENFGGLHQYRLNFSPQLTSIKQPNGFGKTTLAAFIRAMFYGMPRASKSLEKNDRKRYQPWQGGLYGGWLEFEHENTAYRIERSFGLTPKQDTFKLYTLNPFSPSSRFTENIGEEIFGLSVESFERTTYLPQIHWSDSFVNSEIRAQLTNLVENTDDAGDFEGAVQTLRTQRSKYMPYRGKGGSIAEISDRISALQSELFTLEHSRRALPDTQAALLSTEEAFQTKQIELDALRSEMHESYGIVSENALAEQHSALQTQHKTVREQQDAFTLKYPNGLPDDREMTFLTDAVVRQEQAGAWILHPDEQQQLDKLEQLFAPGVPEMEYLDTLENDANRLHDAETLRSSSQKALSALHPEEKRQSHLVFAVLAVVFGIAGAVLYEYYSLYIYAYTALGNAAVCVLAALITGLINGFRKNKIRKLSKEIETLQHTVESLDSQLHTALDPYFVGEYAFAQAANHLKLNLPIYLQLRSKAQSLDERRHAHCSDCAEMISDLFAKYSLSQFAPDSSGLAELRRVREERATVNTMAANTLAQLERFEAKYGHPQHRALTYSVDDLKQKESALLSELDSMQKDIVMLRQQGLYQQTETEKCHALDDELAALQKQQADALAKVSVLDKAIEHLISARQSLSEKYVEPVKERFSQYLIELMKISADSINLDTECNITLEQLGAQRELGYFSVGQVDMIALCMRLALVDVLYGDNTPLLILDDPFVNLDNENLKTALEMLDTLSQTHQILYLTSHDSRCG